MYRRLTVEEFRNDLEQIVEDVRNGDYITLYDGDKPIASLQPVSEVVVSKGEPFPFRDLDFGPPLARLDVDAADLIIEERDRERSGKKYR